MPLLLLGVGAVGLLLLNDDASFRLSAQYEQEIIQLKRQIKECHDSAKYYREQRLAIERGDDELEFLAREKYHMKRPTEDVFILVPPSK